MTLIEQRILALDAKYNVHRAPRIPGFRSLYLKRRSQILKNRKSEIDPVVRKQYLKTRSFLLSLRYGHIADSKSRSLGYRSSSQVTIESTASHSGTYRYSSQSSLRYHIPELTQDGMVPTWAAEASRAMAGGGSLYDNYAFSGMHHIFDVHKNIVTCVKFANDDLSRLASSSLDGSLALHQVLPDPETLFVLKHVAGVTGFCWSSSNELIMSCSEDGFTRLFTSANGQCVRSIRDRFSVPVLCCLFQPINNNMIVTGNCKNYLQFFNSSTGKLCKNAQSKLSAPVLCLCFDVNGNTLWAGDEKGFITSFIYNNEVSRLTRARKIAVSVGRPVTSISMRQWVNREARDPSLLVNCAANFLAIYRITSDDGALNLKQSFIVQHQKYNVKSTFCPLMSFRQGACIVSGSEDGVVYFFNTDRSHKACINKLLGHSSAVIDVNFNSDESLLASCDATGIVIVWKREN